MEQLFEALDDNIQSSFEDILDENGIVSKDHVKGYVDSIFASRIPSYPFPFNGLNLYRARYDTGFDNSDISQFGYIRDVSIIQPLRYNLAGEQVLYTSTHPGIAYKEIVNDSPSEYFYLSIWNKKSYEGTDFMTFLNIPSSVEYLDGNALKYFEVLKGVIKPNSFEYYWSIHLGDLLEGDSSEGFNKDYILSSNIAHKVFTQCDVLLSVSQKSENKELNLNFKKDSADKLECRTIFRCKSPSNIDGELLIFDVDIIAVCTNDNITWYNYEVDDSTIIPLNNDQLSLQMADEAKLRYVKGVCPSQIKIGCLNKHNEPVYIVAFFDNDVKLAFKAKLRLLQC